MLDSPKAPSARIGSVELNLESVVCHLGIEAACAMDVGQVRQLADSTRRGAHLP
jgi:hypothetical protein